MKIGLAQINTHVGAIDTNAKKVLATAKRARDELGCDLLIFPELTLSGYPPEDLLLHRGMRLRVEAALDDVRSGIDGIGLYVGYLLSWLRPIENHLITNGPEAVAGAPERVRRLLDHTPTGWEVLA